MSNYGTVLYMGRTRTGEARHLIDYQTIRRAITDKATVAPALCGAPLTDAVVGEATHYQNEWVVRYAAHWDDDYLCRNCRRIGHRLLEAPRSCSAVGCARLFPATDAALVLCEEHYEMIGPP